MKLCYFNDFRLGVVKGDNVVDVTDAVSHLPHRDTRDLRLTDRPRRRTGRHWC